MMIDVHSFWCKKRWSMCICTIKTKMFRTVRRLEGYVIRRKHDKRRVAGGNNIEKAIKSPFLYLLLATRLAILNHKPSRTAQLTSNDFVAKYASNSVKICYA